MAASSSLSMVIKLIFDSGKTLSNTKSLTRAVGELAGAFAGLKLAQAFAEANREIEGLVRGLNAISNGQGNVYLEQLYNTSNKLGVPIKEVAQSFLELNAATANTAFEGQKTQALFESLANALSTTGSDAVRFNRGFRAMAQILSKDQLFAEELRQQLGEALPTAIQDFSRALKINPQQLFKFMEAGVISGDQLRRTLVLVSQEWKRSYKILEESDFTIDQKIALVRNQIQALYVAVGQTGLWDAFGDSLLTIRDILKDITNEIPAFGDEVKAQFELYNGIIQSTIDLLDSYFPNLKTKIEAAFQAITPKINLDAIKQQFSEILPIIESISLFLNEAETLINNFNAKNKDQLGKGIGEQVTDLARSSGALYRRLILDQVNASADAYKTLFSNTWSYFKGLVNEPLVIKPEIVPLSKEAFKQQSLAPVGLQDREYARYVKRIEEANQKIREQNELARQTNTEINKNNAEEVAKVASIKSATQAYQESINTIRDEYRIKKDINESLRESDRLENQRRGFHQAYLANLKQEESAKQKSLIISKQQFKLDKDLINLQQAYRDSLESINTAKYQRWADQGQITQEAAQFFAKSAKDESLRKAWVEAQDAVEAYNQEAGRGAQANKDTLAALKGLAEDQLAYANSKAKEVGDEYKLKQIFEARTGLLQSQLKLMEDFDKVLQRAENPKQVDVGLNPVKPESVKKVVDQVQESINAHPTPQVPLGVDQKSAIPSIPKALKEAQGAVNQSPPIELSSVLKPPEGFKEQIDSLRSAISQPVNLVIDPTSALAAFGLMKAKLEELKQSSTIQVRFNINDPGGFIKTGGLPKDVETQYRLTVDDGSLTNALANAEALKLAIDGLPEGKTLKVEVLDVNGGIREVTEWTRKDGVVNIKTRTDPNQAASEGAKAGEAASTAANEAVSNNPLTITEITLDSAKINQGIRVAMDQAKATVKTSVAEMNQELVQKLGAQGVNVNIKTIFDQTPFERWKGEVQRLSAEDNRVVLRTDTAALDQEFRRIDGQFAEWNRTAGNGLSAGFVTASQQAQNFGMLVDQVNQKMRAIQSPEKLPPFKPIVEPVVEVKDAYQKMQEQLNQQNPIQVSADAAPLVGEIQQKLNELRASGATNIQVTLDEKTGQLIVTANTDPANEATQALIERIEASDAVLRVRVVYNDPGFSSRSSSTSSDKKRWGGYISGYGGGDRVRALLEPGEFVLRKEAVKALGLSSLIKLNNLGFNAKIPKPSARSVDTLPIPRFASGGMVTGQPIVINVPGGKSIQVQGSRDSAMALANLLTRVGRAV